MLLFKFVGKSSCCTYLFLRSSLAVIIHGYSKREGGWCKKFSKKATCLLITCIYYQINFFRHVCLSQLCLELTFSPSPKKRENGCIYAAFLNVHQGENYIFTNYKFFVRVFTPVLKVNNMFLWLLCLICDKTVTSNNIK